MVQGSDTGFLFPGWPHAWFKTRIQDGGWGGRKFPEHQCPVCWGQTPERQGDAFPDRPDLADHAEPISSISLDFKKAPPILNGSPLKEALRNLGNMAEYESFIKQDVGDVSGTIQLLPQNLFWHEFALP